MLFSCEIKQLAILCKIKLFALFKDLTVQPNAYPQPPLPKLRKVFTEPVSYSTLQTLKCFCSQREHHQWKYISDRHQIFQVKV